MMLYLFSMFEIFNFLLGGNTLHKSGDIFSFGWECKLGQYISDNEYEKSEIYDGQTIEKSESKGFNLVISCSTSYLQDPIF